MIAAASTTGIDNARRGVETIPTPPPNPALDIPEKRTAAMAKTQKKIE